MCVKIHMCLRNMPYGFDLRIIKKDVSYLGIICTIF